MRVFSAAVSYGTEMGYSVLWWYTHVTRREVHNCLLVGVPEKPEGYTVG